MFFYLLTEYYRQTTSMAHNEFVIAKERSDVAVSYSITHILCIYIPVFVIASKPKLARQSHPPRPASPVF